MEKTILIDGRPVTFKSSGAFLTRYKAQFGRDGMKDIFTLLPFVKKYQHLLDKDDLTDEEGIELAQAMDTDMFERFAWTLAKCANPSLPDPATWLNEFESYPIFEIIGEIHELIFASIGFSKK